MRRVLAAALLLILAAPRVLAHPVPFSYLDLRIRQGGIDATLVLHIVDLAHDLNISNPDRLLGPNFAQSRAGDIAALLGSRLTITVDGRTVTPIWSDVEALVDRQAIRARLTYGLEAPPGRTRSTRCCFRTKRSIRPSSTSTSRAASPRRFSGRTSRSTEYVCRHVERRARGARKVRSRRHPSHPDRSGSLAVSRRAAPAWRHAQAVGADRDRFHGGAQHHALAGRAQHPHIRRPRSSSRRLRSASSTSAPTICSRSRVAISATWIAFAFGFIHGFGFASVLREMDLPSQAVGLTLFSFNLGVEIGQLAVVAVVASVFAVVRSQGPIASRRLVVAGSIVVIAAGAFWFVQRVFGL